MKQPYTYSMPESFLKDKSVPARWRVLGVINGFILNGGCFYGSNEWLMEQLGCSEPTISSAFQELESLGEIRTERTKRTRKVYKTSRDQSQFGSETQVEPARDPSQLVPNSVSNSEKNIGELEDEIRIVKESSLEEKEKLPKVIPFPYSVEATRAAWSEGEVRLQVLNWYFTESGLWAKATTAQRLKALMARHNNAAVRIARAEWSPRELKEAKNKIDANESLHGEWTLETLEKYLTK